MVAVLVSILYEFHEISLALNKKAWSWPELSQMSFPKNIYYFCILGE